MVTYRDECVQRFRRLGGAGDGVTECLRTRDQRLGFIGPEGPRRVLAWL